MMARADVVIRGATVYDGLGSPGTEQDVTIIGDRIDEAAPSLDRDAARAIDASGLALAPGFIDVHTHDDLAVLLTPGMECKVMQGVTTDVVGNCGMGAAPYGVSASMFRTIHPDGDIPEWDVYAGYLDLLDRDPASLNVAVLIGHGSVRASVMGIQRRAATTDELDRMAAVVDEGVAAGAVGLSSGLIYEPGRYAPTAELIALASRLRGRGLYASHIRNEGEQLLDAVAEAIRIGEEAGVPVQISHHKASGRAAWGLVGRSIGLIDAARDRGVDVTTDQYPYTAGSTLLQAVMQNLSETSGLGGVEPGDIVIASTLHHPQWEGVDLATLGGELGCPQDEAGFRVLDVEPAATVVLFSMDEADVRTVMRHPVTMIGSDGIPSPGKPHPRLYGTFPRVLGRYGRELGVLTMEAAVQRMTGLPAEKFGLADRGVIRPGAFADLVLFDPQTILDRATYENPRQYPGGIVSVWVNGAEVVKDGAHTGVRPGRTLRREG